MKSSSLAFIALASFLAVRLPAQPAADPATEVEVAVDAPAPTTPGRPAVPGTAANPKQAAGQPAAEGQPAAQMGQQEDGYWLKDAGLNDVLQFLAKKAGKQYFHNASMEGPAFKVTGHLNNGDPEQQMEELAFMYGIELYRKGETVYALNATQVNQLPQEDFLYQLRYLRPTDIDQIKGLVQPALTPGSGIVNFEPKTNTLLIIDSTKRIEAVKDLLVKLDQPKGQIIVETKILRVTSAVGSKVGVDWTSTLGDGITFDAVQSLNGLFNLPEYSTVDSAIKDPSASIGYKYNSRTTTAERKANQSFSVDPVTGKTTKGAFSGTDSLTDTAESVLNELRVQGAGLVLSPMEVSAVLRALNDGNLAKQKSNPTIITEDNESASVSIIDRVPIITATVTNSNGVSQTTEEVRYRVDESDPVNDPEKTREIGVTVSVTPTLLPDNTVRMRLRPRTAQIVEFVKGVPLGDSGISNQYPRVAEATIETIARVPNGYSLLIGGFYNEEETDGDTKVPLLGDIPILNFFFKSKDKSKKQTSLVFIITPTSYDPVGAVETLNVTDQLMDRLDLRADHESINPDAPGAAHKPGLRRTTRAMLFDQTGLPPRDKAEPFPWLEQPLPLLDEPKPKTVPGYEQIPSAPPPPPEALRGPNILNPQKPASLQQAMPEGMGKGKDAQPSAPPPETSKGAPAPAVPPAPAAGTKPSAKPASTPLFR